MMPLRFEAIFAFISIILRFDAAAMLSLSMPLRRFLHYFSPPPIFRHFAAIFLFTPLIFTPCHAASAPPLLFTML